MRNSRKNRPRHHLAVLRREYLRLILGGQKTIECRLGSENFPPHGRVGSGDIVWLKASAGPVQAAATVGRVVTHRNLTKTMLNSVRRDHGAQICAASEFWTSKPKADVVSLIWLTGVETFAPFNILKRDQRAWVVLKKPPVPDEALEPYRPTR